MTTYVGDTYLPFVLASFLLLLIPWRLSDIAIAICKSDGEKPFNYNVH